MYELETIALHAGEEPDPQTGALRLPLHMATSFKLPGFGRKLFDALLMESDRPPHAYTRWSNPTLRALEERMAALEGAGATAVDTAAVATATGMAAVSAILLTFLGQGDHVIASEVCYAGSVELFGEHLPRLGIEVSLVDTSDVEQVLAAMQANTKIVYVETPANPILRISDIGALAEVAHSAGAKLVVDSTWAGPTRPCQVAGPPVVARSRIASTNFCCCGSAATPNDGLPTGTVVPTADAPIMCSGSELPISAAANRSELPPR